MELNAKNNKPCVFEYNNYREYLNDLYVFFKAETNFFSYRYFSKKAGFKSPNFLKLVIDGQRNLTEDSAHKVAWAFALNKSEKEYFYLLVGFCQAQSQEEKFRYSKSLARNKVVQKAYPLKHAEYNYYTYWYYIPLRELVATKTFIEDYHWIESQFQNEVSATQLQKAISEMLEIGLLIRDENGVLKQNHKNVMTSGEVMSSLITNYHKIMIAKASESIEDYAPEFREISGTCISCSQQNVEKLKELVREFRKDILALTEDSTEADLVYQLNFQLYPLTGVKKRN